MPIYMSLLIDGIEADGSVNQLHKGEMNVMSFSWGVSTNEAATGGGGGTGKARFDDLVIVKQMDQASPRLMLACSSGRHSKFAIFKIVSTNEDGRPTGNNLLVESAASGSPQVGTAGTNGLGTIAQGTLETSNVNSVTELVSMIECQRSYEMNSKVVSAADEMMSATARLGGP